MADSTLACLKALADHTNVEERASRVYRQLAAWCDYAGYEGSRKFFAGEAADEFRHAEEFRQYATDRGVQVTLKDQGKVESPASLRAAFETAMDLERTILGQINWLGNLAIREGDLDSVRFLQQFAEAGTASIRRLDVLCLRLARLADDMTGVYAFDDMLNESAK